MNYLLKIFIIFAICFSYQTTLLASSKTESMKAVKRIIIALELGDKSKFDEYQREISQKGYASIELNGKRFFVFIYRDKSYAITGHGTGFLVSDEGHFVTNDHVVKSTIEKPKLKLFLALAAEPKLELVPLKLIRHTKANDLAIVQAETQININPVTIYDPDINHLGENVFALGFPSGADIMIEAGSTININVSITNGALSAYPGAIPWNTNERNMEVVQHSAEINKGNSGGPLINNCGETVGVNVGMPAGIRSITTGIFYAVHGNELVAELDAASIDYNLSSNACTGDGDSMIVWLAIVLLALLLVIIAIVLFFLRYANQINKGENKSLPINSKIIRKAISKRIDKIEGDAEQVKDRQGSQWKKNDAGLWCRFDENYNLIFWDKPGRPDEQSKIDFKDSVNLIPQRKGPTIHLKIGEPVFVGRKPGQKNQVIINGPHVSRNHARLIYDGKDVCVEDLNSLNGVYVSGKKVIDKMPVMSQQLLCFGDEEFSYLLAGNGSKEKIAIAELKPIGDFGREVTFFQFGKLNIGRSHSNDIVISVESVSNQHATIVADGKKLTLVDKSSTNGTFVNQMNNKVKSAILKNGDIIYIAEKKYGFKVQYLQ